MPPNVVVRVAASVFRGILRPFHAVSRFLGMLASGDSEYEIQFLSDDLIMICFLRALSHKLLVLDFIS